jgi:hypothetical protein
LLHGGKGVNFCEHRRVSSGGSLGRCGNQSMTHYKYLDRYWYEFLAAASLLLVAMIVAAPLWW